LRIQVSQGSVVTDLRWGGRFNTTFHSSRPENRTEKELFKSVYTCQSYCKNKSGILFLRHSVVTMTTTTIIILTRKERNKFKRAFCQMQQKLRPIIKCFVYEHSAVVPTHNFAMKFHFLCHLTQSGTGRHL